MHYVAEQFTPEEEAALRPYFTNLDGPVFALVNLPEVVKGALFARYSRSPKSLRRLFLDEFVERHGLLLERDEAGGGPPSGERPSAGGAGGQSGGDEPGPPEPADRSPAGTGAPEDGTADPARRQDEVAGERQRQVGQPALDHRTMVDLQRAIVDIADHLGGGLQFDHLGGVHVAGDAAGHDQVRRAHLARLCTLRPR